MKTRRRPSRSAARPPSSRKPANVSVYALTTHCRSVAVKPRSLRIDGSATFTIETSRMTMNCARQQRKRVQFLRDILEALNHIAASTPGPKRDAATRRGGAAGAVGDEARGEVTQAPARAEARRRHGEGATA